MFHILYSLLWGFIFLSLLYQLRVCFDLAVCSKFQCTCWRLFYIIIDYSKVISLVWTTCGFYPCIEGFFTLNKLCLLCVIFLNFYFALYILLVFLTSSCKFGKIYFHCLLLSYWICYCVDFFFHHQRDARLQYCHCHTNDRNWQWK